MFLWQALVPSAWCFPLFLTTIFWLQVITPPIKTLNSRVRTLEEEIRKLKQSNLRHDNGPAARDGCLTHQPESANVEACSQMQTAPSRRSTQGLHHVEPVVNRCCQMANHGKGPDASIGLSNFDQDQCVDSAMSHQAETGTLKCIPIGSSMLSPDSRGAVLSGRMMMISWRAANRNSSDDGITSIAQDIGRSSSESTTNARGRALHDNTCCGGGQVMSHTWTHGAGMVSCRGMGWSQLEECAMTMRLDELCRTYDSAHMLPVQPLAQAGMITSSSIRDECRAGGFQSQHMFGTGTGHHSAGTSDTGGSSEYTVCADEISKTSAVPGSSQKLQAVGKMAREASASQHQPFVRASFKKDVDRNLMRGSFDDTGARGLTQHGLLTLLACALCNVMWASPVV